jgi:hypothetical protein
MSNQISDEALLKLWRDPLFLGSYRGVKTFQVCLKTDKDIVVSQKRLYKLLRTDENFLMHQSFPKNIARRQLSLNNYGEVVFGDLAYMYPFEVDFTSN